MTRGPWDFSDVGKSYYQKYHMKRRLENPKKYLVYWAKKGAQKRNIEFNITENDIEIPTICPVLGIPLEIDQEKGRGTGTSPSIDRFDNSLGYVKGNVNVISWRANELKRNGTLDEFRRLVSWMEGKSAEKSTQLS